MAIPDDHDLVRTTAVFDEHSIPAGLLKAHRVAAGVWGNLVVHEGAIDFSFEDDEADDQDAEKGSKARTVAAGEHQPIPPDRPHRLTITGPVRLVVEFHRPRSDA